MKETYRAQEFRNDGWRALSTLTTRAMAVTILFDHDDSPEKLPRQVIDAASGEIVVYGRHCKPAITAFDAPASFWLIVPLDKPMAYPRHFSKDSAIADARRQASSVDGGRIGVVELVHVTGWLDTEIGK